MKRCGNGGASDGGRKTPRDGPSHGAPSLDVAGASSASAPGGPASVPLADSGLRDYLCALHEKLAGMKSKYKVAPRKGMSVDDMLDAGYKAHANGNLKEKLMKSWQCVSHLLPALQALQANPDDTKEGGSKRRVHYAVLLLATNAKGISSMKLGAEAWRLTSCVLADSDYLASASEHAMRCCCQLENHVGWYIGAGYVRGRLVHGVKHWKECFAFFESRGQYHDVAKSKYEEVCRMGWLPAITPGYMKSCGIYTCHVNGILRILEDHRGPYTVMIGNEKSTVRFAHVNERERASLRSK